MPDPPAESAHARKSFFSEPKPEAEVVPSPQFFVDIVSRPWATPGAGANPSSLDKQFFNTYSELSQTLQVPAVDGPIVLLVTSPIITDAPEEALRSEDR